MTDTVVVDNDALGVYALGLFRLVNINVVNQFTHHARGNLSHISVSSDIYFLLINGQLDRGKGLFAEYLCSFELLDFLSLAFENTPSDIVGIHEQCLCKTVLLNTF